MAIDELKAELGAILTVEEQSSPDWQKVERGSLRKIERLATETEPSTRTTQSTTSWTPDVRQKSPKYGEAQRQRLRQWLDEG